MTALFHGNALCEVDGDGNVVLPGFVEDGLRGEEMTDLLVSKHECDACLIGYGSDRLTSLTERAERQRLADEARGEDARNLH